MIPSNELGFGPAAGGTAAGGAAARAWGLHEGGRPAAAGPARRAADLLPARRARWVQGSEQKACKCVQTDVHENAQAAESAKSTVS